MDRTYKLRVARLMFKHMPSLTKEQYEEFKKLCDGLDLTVNDVDLDKAEWRDILEEEQNKPKYIKQ